MGNKLGIWLKNNLEILLSILISFSITILIICKDENFIIKFIESGIASTLIGVFGSLLGLLLTAYAILFAISPILNKGLLKSGTFSRINLLFLGSIILTIILLVSTISLNFLDSQTGIIYLIYFNLFLFILDIELIFIIGLILFLLFKISKKEILRNSSS